MAHRRVVAVLGIGLILATLSGCSKAPSESDVRDALVRHSFGPLVGDRVQPGTFYQLIIREGSEDRYQAEVRYPVIFIGGFNDVTQDLMDRHRGAADAQQKVRQDLQVLNERFGPFKAGDRVDRHDFLPLVRKDGRWDIDDSWVMTPPKATRQ